MRTGIRYDIFWIATLLITVQLLHTAVACGQSATLQFQHLGIADGLPQNTILAMKEDASGFLWFGTNGGLCRYDGYECKTFRHGQAGAQSLANNHVNCIEDDRQGQLLIGTDNGLSLLNRVTETFTMVAGSKGLIITKIKTDSRNRIWVGTSDGVMEYDAHKGGLTRLRMAGYVYEGDEVASIEEDEEHCIWVAYYSHRLLRFDPVKNTLVPLPAALLADTLVGKDVVSTLKRDPHGNMWLGTIWHGIVVLQPTAGKCMHIGNSGKGTPYYFERIRDILFREGEVWIAARNGLYKTNPEGSSIARYLSDAYDAASLSNSSMCALLQDRSGVLWIGTYLGGVNYLQPGNNAFTYLNRLTRGGGLNNKVVYALGEDTAGNWWVGTGGGGVNFYDAATGSFRYYHMTADQRSSEPDYIRAVCVTTHSIWAGSLNGLYALEKPTNSFIKIPLQEKATLTPRKWSVCALEQDGNNGLWIGTQQGIIHRDAYGALLFRNGKQGITGGLAEGGVMALKQDREGGLWIGRANGLSYQLPGKDSIINFSDAAVANQHIFSIQEDRNGTIWIGTDENGLVYFDKRHHQFGSVDTAFGLADQSVRGIVQDKEGHVWISCINGIYRLRCKKALPPFAAADIIIDRFSVENGLRSNEFLSAAHQTADGKLVFGGYDGIAIVNPALIPDNQYLAPVVITDFQINNQPVTNHTAHSPLSASITYTKEITLAYNQAYFSLRFAALSFVNSHSNQYAYMLEGLKNDQWHYVGNDRAATYTNLSPGAYVFKVRAANNNGRWNTAYTTLHITILPPLWGTWYALLLYGLVVTGLLYLYYSYSVKATRLKHELRLQHAINEKEKEFAEQKIEFFTNISHEIKTPLTLILAPLDKMVKSAANEEAGSRQSIYLSMMQRNGDKLMKLVNQLLEFRRLEKGFMKLDARKEDMVAFVSTVVDNFQSLATKKEIRLRWETTADNIMVSFDAEKWEKVVNNLVSNALKFTQQGGMVAVRLSVKEEEGVSFFEMNVMDNGAGIDAAHLANIFEPFHYYDKATANGSGIGLSYTKGIVSLHGGKISVTSRQRTPHQEGYTVFTLQLPYVAVVKRREARKEKVSKLKYWL